MVLENCKTSDVKINPEKKKSFKNMNYRELSLKASKFEMCIGSNCNEESKKGLNSNLIIFLLQNKKKVNRTCACGQQGQTYVIK